MSAPLPPPVLPPPSRPRGRPALSPETHGTLGRLVEHRLSPRRLRWLFVFFVVALQALVWATYLNSVSVLERKAEDAFRDRLEALALILNEHVSNALDTVSGRLRVLASLTTPEALQQERLTPALLDEIIFDDPLMRSISLLDPDGKVVASSWQPNIGHQIAAQYLPPRTLNARSGEPRFGQLLPFRTLADVGHTQAPEGVSLWLEAIDVHFGEQVFQWIAVINPNFFGNFWLRVLGSEPHEVRLLDYKANLVSALPAMIDTNDPLTSEIAKHADINDNGRVEATSPPRRLAVYRTSTAHPLIVAVIGDREQAAEQLAGDLLRFRAVAIGASLLALALCIAFYRSYLRYEDSVAELINQATAIGAHLMVSESDPEGRIVAANAAFLEASGYRLEELVGQKYGIFNSNLHNPEFFSALWEILSSGQIWKGTFRNLNKDGRIFWVSTTIVPYFDAWGNITRYVAFYSDITEAIQLSERLDRERALREELTRINQSLDNEANTDPLTLLPNRRAFEHFSAQALASTRQNRQVLAVAMLDIDHFKAVNDTYGHAAGDEVLREMAHRWSSRIRTSDMLARIGGEEFCLLLPQADEVSARRVTEEIRLESERTPVTVTNDAGEQSLTVTVSIGVVSVAAQAVDDIDPLLERADKALYAAKQGGRNRVVELRYPPPEAAEADGTETQA